MRAVFCLLCILAFLLPGCASIEQTSSRNLPKNKQTPNTTGKLSKAEPAPENGSNHGGLTIRKAKKQTTVPVTPVKSKLPDVKKPFITAPEKFTAKQQSHSPDNPRVGARPGATPREKSPEPEKPAVSPADKKPAGSGEETSTLFEIKPSGTQSVEKSTPRTLDLKSLSTDELYKELLRRQRQTVREKPLDASAKLRLAETLRIMGRTADAKRSLKEIKKNNDFALSIEKARLEFELGNYDRLCKELKSVLGEAKLLAPLSIPVSAFAKKIEGYGRYTPIASAAYPAGSHFSAYVEIENFINGKKTGSSKYVTSMEIGYEIINIADRVVFEKLHFDSWEYTTQSNIKYLYINLSDYLPSNLAAGRYTLRVYVLDRLKPTGAKAIRDLQFKVK